MSDRLDAIEARAAAATSEPFTMMIDEARWLVARVRELESEAERCREGWTNSDVEFDHFLDDLVRDIEWDGDLTPETVLAWVRKAQAFLKEHAALSNAYPGVTRARAVLVDGDAAEEGTH